MESGGVRNIHRDLAMRLRFENNEQYNTLVRMHLSFELDLHTKENEDEGPEKGIFKRLNRFSKKTKPICTSSTKAVNSPPEPHAQPLSREIVAKLEYIIEFLMKEDNLVQEGIFRRTGSVARQTELKNAVMGGKQPINLNSGSYTVHDCASVLKGILSDLPEPLLMDAYYPAHCELATLYNSNNNSDNSSAIKSRLLTAIQLLFLLLPLENRELMEWILKLLHETTLHTDKNKMSADTLSTLFTPHLICPRKLSPEALHSVSQQLAGIISFMITEGSQAFDVPAKLGTDIRMYFVEQKRKRTMSPEMILDESVTSDSTAATVFTFVDRTQTAKAHDSMPTDTALAQLYAHIQSLPESSKKRKLIKQFNKENGHGTPLQQVIMNRMKQGSSSKQSMSLGDSIKRHILGNRLIPKTTPKRILSSTSTSFDSSPSSTTPNRSKYDSHYYNNITPAKKRVLFQTPPPKSNISSFKSKATPINLPPPSLIVPITKPHEPILKTNTSKGSTTIQSARAAESAMEPEAGMVVSEEGQEDTDVVRFELKRKYMSEPNLRSFTENDVNSFEGGRMTSVSLMDIEAMTKALHSNAHAEADGSDIQSKERLISIGTSTEEFVAANGRPSMSPITKSTRRMPKYMQESIMTPRSRKPVMLLGLTLGNTSNASSTSMQSQSQSKTLSFREEDEFSLDSQTTRNDSDLMKVSSFETGDESSTTECCKSNTYRESRIGLRGIVDPQPDSLTSTFRDYLFSRSVLTESPADLSFSSQPDDFGANLDDIRELNESKLADSLLYCLDGNEPNGDAIEDDVGDTEHLHLRQNYHKRRSSEMEIKVNADEEREIKKLVLHVSHQAISDGIGETSL